MAITFQKRRGKQRYLLLIFLISIAVIFSTIYFGYLRNKPLPPPPFVIFEPPKVEINFDVLKHPFLKDSLPYEEIRPFEEKTGRENPFEPY